jgi:hypothetical protein
LIARLHRITACIAVVPVTLTRGISVRKDPSPGQKKKTRGPAKLVVLFGGGVDRARGSCSFPFALWAGCLLAEASLFGPIGRALSAYCS